MELESEIVTPVNLKLESLQEFQWIGCTQVLKFSTYTISILQKDEILDSIEYEYTLNDFIDISW